MYLTSPGRPTDIGVQLGKACYPCSRYKGRERMFYFLCFFTFIPVHVSSLSLSLSSPLLSLQSRFSLSLGETQNEPQGLMCR